MYKKITNIYLSLIKYKFVIYQLTKKEFQNRYIGSVFGFLWAIIQPIFTILVLWFVFSFAFHTKNIDNIPYFVWLTVGIISWDFLSSTLSSSTNVFQEYSYLVKKINFNIAILPIIKILSSSLSHAILSLILIFIVVLNGIFPNIFWFGTLYYFLCSITLLFGLSFITSSIQVFFRDVSQVVNISLNFGFWLTPILWNFDAIDQRLKFFVKLNPFTYIINGYRDSLLYQKAFWEDPYYTLYFWFFVLFIIFLGCFIFSKLKSNFADVL